MRKNVVFSLLVCLGCRLVFGCFTYTVSCTFCFCFDDRETKKKDNERRNKWECKSKEIKENRMKKKCMHQHEEKKTRRFDKANINNLKNIPVSVCQNFWVLRTNLEELKQVVNGQEIKKWNH
jgi:hypothetical protein